MGLRAAGSRMAGVLSGVVLVAAAVAVVFGCVGIIRGDLSLAQVIGLAAGCVVALVAGGLLFAVAMTGAVNAVLTDFFQAMNDKDFVRAHSNLFSGTRARLTPEDIARRFPYQIVRHRILRAQITKVSPARNGVSKLCKAAVWTIRPDDLVEPYLFLLMYENGRWAIDDWIEGHNYDRVTYDLE